MLDTRSLATEDAALLRRATDGRHAKLAIDACGPSGPVKAVRTEVEAESVTEMRGGTAAECAPLFEQRDRPSGACEIQSCRKTGKTSLPVWRIRWRDAAARGFCALPAERFLRGH
jgi:hypothetical protein